MSINFQTSIWLEIDNETDDILALLLLQLLNFKFDHIVVGESDPLLKAKQLVEGGYLFNSISPIIIGLPSEKQHPIDPVLLEKSKNEEKEINSNHYPAFKNKQEYRKCLLNYLISTPRPILVVLKPPRELFELIQDAANSSFNSFNSSNFEQKDEKQEEAICILHLLKTRAILYFYGSFNLRVLKPEHHQFHQFMKSFHQVYLFESFHALGLSNSINQHTMPHFFKTWNILRKITEEVKGLKNLKEDKKDNQKENKKEKTKHINVLYPHFLIAFSNLDLWMKTWNEYILNQKSFWLDSSAKAVKLVKDLEENKNFQMVTADMILALFVETDPKKLEQFAPLVNIDWDEKGMSRIVDKSELKLESSTSSSNLISSVHLFQKLNWEELQYQLCSVLNIYKNH